MPVRFLILRCRVTRLMPILSARSSILKSEFEIFSLMTAVSLSIKMSSLLFIFTGCIFSWISLSTDNLPFNFIRPFTRFSHKRRSSSNLNGFEIKASAPISQPLIRVSYSALVVSKIIGMIVVRELDFNRFNSSKPSMRGIMTSETIRSTPEVWAMLKASIPSLAVNTLYSIDILVCKYISISSSSSTISNRGLRLIE